MTVIERALSPSLAHLAAVADFLGPSVRRHSIYDDVFADYICDLNDGVDWDCRLIADGLRHCGVGDGAHVVDLCCGAGRVAAHLAAHGWAVTGVDRSADLLGRDSGDAAGFRRVRVDVADPSLAARIDRPAAAVVLSAATVNCFPDEEALRGLAAAAHSLLQPAGILLLPVFDDGARLRFEAGFPDRIVAHPVRRAGAADLVVWTSLAYDAATRTLHQAALTTTGGAGDGVHHYAYNVDRIWTAGEIPAVMAAAGFRSVLSREASVAGGGADGFPFRLCGFQAEGAGRG